MRNEYLLLEKYPKIFEAIPENTDKRAPKKPKPRGNNTNCALFNKLRAFFNWCNENHITENRPFLGYRGVTVEKYGTPYYITQEERNQIAEFDLSAYPALEVQRDIFIFQCLIGCLIAHGKKNICGQPLQESKRPQCHFGNEWTQAGQFGICTIQRD